MTRLINHVDALGNHIPLRKNSKLLLPDDRSWGVVNNYASLDPWRYYERPPPPLRMWRAGSSHFGDRTSAWSLPCNDPVSPPLSRSSSAESPLQRQVSALAFDPPAHPRMRSGAFSAGSDLAPEPADTSAFAKPGGDSDVAPQDRPTQTELEDAAFEALVARQHMKKPAAALRRPASAVSEGIRRKCEIGAAALAKYRAEVAAAKTRAEKGRKRKR